jgi:hypothetical protein
MDDTGTESSYWETITVNIVNRLPYIVVEEEVKVYPDEEVVFEGFRSWDQDGHIINYSWEFEDNTTLYGPNVSHTFHEPGIYNIFLLVLDDDRKTNKSSVRVVVLEETASKSRTFLGITVIAVTAFIGVAAILFGRRVLPAPLRTQGRHRITKSSLAGAEGELVSHRAETWLNRYKSGLPTYDKITIHDYNEPFVYKFALFNLHRQIALEASKASVKDESDDEDEVQVDEQAVAVQALNDALGRNYKPSYKETISVLKAHKPPKGEPNLSLYGAAVIALAQANAPAGTVGKPNGVTNPYLKAYHTIHKEMTRHELLGGARYYVPRTGELEAMAAFAALKLIVYRHALQDGTGGNTTGLNESERTYISSLVTLMGRCWKSAHSFRARAHSSEAKLNLTLIMFEKAGKHRFGFGKIDHVPDPIEDDDELDRIEDMLDLYNQTWSVLQFNQFNSIPTNSKEILALHTFDTLGAQRYLNQSDES